MTIPFLKTKLQNNLQNKQFRLTVKELTQINKYVYYDKISNFTNKRVEIYRLWMGNPRITQE